MYLACDNGIGLEQLYRRLSAEGLSESRTERIVSDLVERRLLLLLDHHLLSLGVPKPLKETPKTVQESAGFIDETLYRALTYLGGGSKLDSGSGSGSLPAEP